MYLCLLLFGLALVVLSPLFLELYLTVRENRALHRHAIQAAKAKGPRFA